MSVEIMNNTEIPPIWLSVSNRQNDINPSGFKYTEITTKKDLEDSFKYDHLFSSVRHGYREDKNFEETNNLWAICIAVNFFMSKCVYSAILSVEINCLVSFK